MKTYTVEFYELINYGGNWVSNGTTTVSGYEETFGTEIEEEARKEFEERKKVITPDNKLGVTLSTWVNDEEVDQTSFTSENLK